MFRKRISSLKYSNKMAKNAQNPISGAVGGAAGGAGMGGGGVPLIKLEGIYRLRLKPVSRKYDATDSSNNLWIGHEIAPGSMEMALVQHWEPYFADQTYAQRNIYCQIGGLFYLGQLDDPKLLNHGMGSMTAYWKHVARRQFGVHVFGCRDGAVLMVRIRPDVTECPNSSLMRIRLPLYCQLYPSVRCEHYLNPDVHPDLTQEDKELPNYYYYILVNPNTGDEYEWASMDWLTIGLCFTGAPQRTPHYHDCAHFNRNHPYDGLPYNPATSRVIELTDNNVDYVIEKVETATPVPRPPAPAVGRRFAIYVCAGAKLSVLGDQLDKIPGKTDQPHNRSLIQQGGVVIGEGELHLSAPISDRRNGVTNRVTLREWLTTREAAIPSTNPFQFNSDDMLQRAAHYDNPVLFMAPNESEHGSIAWQLAVVSNVVDKNGLFQYLLEMPEGGRIEAILDWPEGIVELKARHLYERRHESHVQMDAPNEYVIQRFETPEDPALMRRIVTNRKTDTGIERDVRCDIFKVDPAFTNQKVGYLAQRGRDLAQLPVVYNAHRVVNWAPTHPENTRPPMPPDWPLIQYADEVDDDDWVIVHSHMKYYNRFAPPYGVDLHVKYLFNDYGQLCSKYLHESANSPVMYTPAAHKHRHPVYKFEKMPITANPYAVCDGVNAYLGIDGYVWAKQQPQQPGAECKEIGEYESRVYEAVTADLANVNPPDATKIANRTNSQTNPSKQTQPQAQSGAMGGPSSGSHGGGSHRRRHRPKRGQYGGRGQGGHYGSGGHGGGSSGSRRQSHQ